MLLWAGGVVGRGRNENAFGGRSGQLEQLLVEKANRADGLHAESELQALDKGT